MAEKGDHRELSPETVALIKALVDSGNENMRALVEGLQARNPSALDQLGLSSERQMALMTQEPGKRYRHVPVKGNGKGIARVQESPKYKNGIIVQVLEYKWPDGIFARESDGGLVPDGMYVHREDTNHGLGQFHAAVRAGALITNIRELSVPYRMWLLTEFHWKDVRDTWIGRQLQPHWCDLDAGKGLDTPWDAATAVAA